MYEWKSPIDTAMSEMQMTMENEVIKAIQKVGITVDKAELLKALEYDRGQYDKGYKDGYRAKEFDRSGDCKGCKYSEGIYFRERCEGCCRNYADGYVAEQTESQTERSE